MSNSIVSYLQGTALTLPTEAGAFPICLGEALGRSYLSLPEGVTLPGQPPECDYRTEQTPLAPEIEKQLFLVRQINAETQGKIRENYSLEDELKALRQGDQKVLDGIAAAVAEGKAKKAALGL